MGMIALVGGDEFRADCVPMDRELLAMIARRPARVVILPTAAAQQGPGMATANGVRYFAGLGAEAASAMVLTRGDADDPAFVAALADADLIYLTGGSPSHLFDALRDSAMWDAIRRRYQAGALIAGSSAGAMTLGAAMRYRSSAWTPTLGLAARVAVIPHHDGSAAPWQTYTTDLRGSLPQLQPPPTVVGVATATACVSADGMKWGVIGVGAVTVYAPDGAQRYTAGEQFTLA